MSSATHKDRIELEVIAMGIGCVVAVPTDCELFLDIDRPGALPNIETYNILAGRGLVFGPESWLTTKSRNGNTHVYIRLVKSVVEKERILLQTCLGSDVVKETLSWVQSDDGDCDCPVALFEVPAEYERVIAWRIHERITRNS